MTTQAGNLVWRNKDPALEAQARASFETLSSAEMRKVPVGAKVSGSIGQVGLMSVRTSSARRAIAPCPAHATRTTTLQTFVQEPAVKALPTVCQSVCNSTDEQCVGV